MFFSETDALTINLMHVLWIDWSDPGKVRVCYNATNGPDVQEYGGAQNEQLRALRKQNQEQSPPLQRLMPASPFGG